MTEIDVGTIVLAVIILVIVIFVIVVLAKSIRIIPQAYAGVVERLGRYHKTLTPGLNILVPFIDRLRPLVDMREQVVSFPPQPVITEDNLVVSIDTVVYFQVTDARAATYEIANYLGAVEQLTTTTLRNVVGGLNLEEALTSRDNINGQLRVVLDEATGKWGIRVGRVELKAIDPPHSIQDSMEKQMRAERDRRALILTAEGTKQSAILTAEGARQAEILEAEGDAKAAVLRAQGEAEAIQTVFDAIHKGDPDPKLLAYQYLQTLPKIAEGASNKLWIIPSELTEALKGIGTAFTPQPRRDDGCPGGAARDGRRADRPPLTRVASTYFDPPRPRVLAHRGLALEAPENTLLAFAHAVAIGAAYIETDVHLTADGVAVLSHDPTLRRVAGRRRRRVEADHGRAPTASTSGTARALLARGGARRIRRDAVQHRREGRGRRRGDRRARCSARARAHACCSRASRTSPPPPRRARARRRDLGRPRRRHPRPPRRRSPARRAVGRALRGAAALQVPERVGPAAARHAHASSSARTRRAPRCTSGR